MNHRVHRLALAAAAGFLLAGCGSDPATTAPESAQTAGSPATSEAPASPLEGVFRCQSTREELSRSHLLMDRHEINDGNWGLATLRFDGNAVEFAMANDIAASETSGTFSIDGDLVTLHFTTGVNAGETFAMHYALDGDTLTLTRDPQWASKSLIAPTPFVIKSWRRVS